MGKGLKAIFTSLIMLLLILVIVPLFLPDIETEASAVADNASWPTIIRAVFGLWWVPIALIMVTVILSGARGLGGGGSRRFRRRR